MRARNALWMVVGWALGVPACTLHDNGLSMAALSTPEDGGLPADDGPADDASASTGGSGGATGGSGGATGGSGGAGGVAAGGQGGGAPADAGPVGPRDASVPDAARADAAGVTAGIIVCGAARCDADKEICCVGATGAGTCSKGACPATEATRRCDGPEDCDGERICCAQDALVGAYRTACVRPNECANAGGVPLCRSNADCFDGYKGCATTDFSGWEVSTCHR